MIRILKILLHNVSKIINLRYPTYVYQFLIFLIITKKKCWPVFKQDPNYSIHKLWYTQRDKLDVDPQRDDDASPMSTYRCMLRPTWMISALQHKSKYKSNSISNFLKKNPIFWFPCCSTCEDLSVDVSITNVGLIVTKPGRFRFSAYGNSGYRQNSISSISNFLKKLNISGFPWCSTREDLSIDVSITNVGLILTKIRRFQLFVKSQNSNFELFWKKIQIFGFPWCSTREDLSIYVSITNVGLILTKLWWYLFSGCGQADRQTDGRTDRRTDRQTRFWNPHMETCRHTKNFNSKLKISG